MAKFILEINTGGAAFDDGEEGITEIARILEAAAAAVGFGHTSFVLHDINGNRVGFFGRTEV